MNIDASHLKGYLTSKLKIYCTIDHSIGTLFSVSNHQYCVNGNFNFKNGTSFKQHVNIDFNNFINLASPRNFKPILTPLSDVFTKPEWQRKLVSFLSKGVTDKYPERRIQFVSKPKHRTIKVRLYDYDGPSSEWTEWSIYKEADPEMTKYDLMEWYFKNHIDVFKLIQNNLAIDINYLPWNNDID